jgi:hypothetical protein
MVSAGDGSVRSGQKFSFTTAGYSTLRLQELLAQLGYLPMSWAPAAGAAILDESPAAQLAAAYQPPPGTFTWRHGYPRSLYSFWREGSANRLDQGAITGFEADHGMTTDGGSYGYPQALGCVELPYSAAAAAYPYLPYGTLVTVTP